jgi:predicted TPR repeat methyltransferase
MDKIAGGRRNIGQSGFQQLQPWLIALLLGVVTLVVFGEVSHHDFVAWDDDIHVYENPFLKQITIENILRFWQHPYQGLYNPLSNTVWAILTFWARLPETVRTEDGFWLDLAPKVFHSFNLGLHTINAVLVFFLLRFLIRTGAQREQGNHSLTTSLYDWSAAGGAALFALHPLQVESVSWVSELRGLLSATFALIALLIYGRFVESQLAMENATGSGQEKPSRTRQFCRYSGALACFILALLAKPSAIVLPVIACIFEVWTFRRTLRQSIRSLSLWFLVAIGWAIVTKLSQPIDPFLPVLPLWTRPFVAGDALAFYLSKILLPINLAIDYGRTPEAVMKWPSWGYLTWLIPVGILAYLWRKRGIARWPLVAAGIFVVGVLPVLGLSPFNFQLYSTVADRYVYLAMLGPALALTHVLALYHSRAIQAVTLLGLFLMGAMSLFQVLNWSNNKTLFEHALAVNPRSTVAHNNLGNIAQQRGDLQGAFAHYQEILRIKPDHATAQAGMGTLLLKQGRVEEGLKYFQRAVELIPKNAMAHVRLAHALAVAGRMPEASQSYAQALRLDPREEEAAYLWGSDLEKAGQISHAILCYQLALQIDPSHKMANAGLARALAKGPTKAPAPARSIPGTPSPGARLPAPSKSAAPFSLFQQSLTPANAPR